MNNIAIIEYRQNIDEALKLFSPKDTLFLSASGETSYYLTERDISFLTTEDILSPEKFRDLGCKDFGITEKWVQGLEEVFHSMLPQAKDRDFFPFRWHFHRMKILVDAIVTRHALLEHLIETRTPQVLGLPRGADIKHIHDHNMFFQKYDSIYGLVGESIAKKKGIKHISWKNVAPPLEINTRLERIMRDRLKNSRLVNAILSLKKTAGPGKENVILSTVDYDIVPLMKALSSKFDFYRYENPLSIRHIGSLTKVLHGAPKSADFPKIDAHMLGHSVSPSGIPEIDALLQDRICSYIKSAIPILWKGQKYLEEADKKKNFKAFLNTGGVTDSYAALPLYYFKRKQKPAIVIQHGDHGLALTKITVYGECGHDGYYFSWGNAVSEMYDTRKKGACRIIPTGSYLIEDIKRNRKMRKVIKKVCYVQNLYRANAAYYPDGQSCCDSRFFQLETSFLKTLIPFQKSYDITYKIPPTWAGYNEELGYNPMIKWVKKNLPFVRLVSAPLSSIIQDFDCFIIDWPSTALIQSCASGAEVLVYNGSKYRILEKDITDLLGKRAIIGVNEADFQDKIRKTLGSGVVASNVDDVSFLEQCGIFKDDGLCLQRMVHNVESILKTDGKPEDRYNNI